MRSRLLTLLFLFLFTALSCAADWSRVIESVSRSTVQLWCQPHNQPLCTAFSINAREGYFLTAAHCLEEGAPVVGDFETAVVLFADTNLDIAVLRFDTVRLPALSPRIGPLRVGEDVAGFGFAYGLTAPLFRSAIVSGLFSDGWVAFDKAWIGGMSGGPVVDSHGRVVSVVSRGDMVNAWGQTMRRLFEATAVYWESR